MNDEALESKARMMADRLGIVYELVRHIDSGQHTAQASAALGELPCHILKCLILIDDHAGSSSVGAIIRGDTRLNVKVVQQATGTGKLRFASPDEIAFLTGFRVGGVPPFSLVECDSRLICTLVLQESYVIGAGGHEHCGAKLRPEELLKIPDCRVQLISRC
jgi:prolyl-tRNA editing enzyme YbaK/EbsC (Cys-tRNA(Pro) deacylase)